MFTSILLEKFALAGLWFFFPPPTPKDDAVGLAGETILTDGADNNGGGQRKDNPCQDGSGKEEHKPSNDDGWKTSGAVDK